MPGRYGAAGDDPRIDPSFSLEGYADPSRVIGPIRATTPLPNSPVFPGPVSIGADTGCANAVLRVTGGIHTTNSLGVGLCPPDTTPGNAWISNQLVVGTDPTGSEILRVGGATRMGALIVNTSVSPSITYRRSGSLGGGAFDSNGVVLSSDMILGPWNDGVRTGGIVFATAVGQTLTNRMALVPNALQPITANGLTLGTSSLYWGDGFLDRTTVGITSGGGVLSLKPGSADHVYIQFFARTATPAVRSAYIGFGSGGGTTLEFTNEVSAASMYLGAGTLRPSSASGLTLGTASLPWSSLVVTGPLAVGGLAGTTRMQWTSAEVISFLGASNANAKIIAGVADITDDNNGIAIGTSFGRLFFTVGSTHKPWKISAQDSASETLQFSIATANNADPRAASYTNLIFLDGTGLAFKPAASAGLTLGTLALPWSDTFIANGKYYGVLDSGASLGVKIGVPAASNTLEIRNQNTAGIDIYTSGTIRWTINSSGHLIAATDNSFDIGAAGANRPRDVYIAGNLTVGGTSTLAGVVKVLYQNQGLSTNSTSDVSLASYSLPASTLASNGQSIRITLCYRATVAAGQLNIKFGASVVCNIAPAAGVSGTVIINIIRSGAATQFSHAMCLGSSLVIGDDTNLTLTPSETLSGAVTIDFRGNTAAGGTISYDIVKIEFLST